MQPKLLKTTFAEYVPATFTGKNESGITPIGDRVVVMPDESSDQTTGKVFIDPRTQDRATQAAEAGVIVAIGDMAWAWNSDRTRPFDGRKPKVGDRVCFQRYAGQIRLGRDGKSYRVMDDNVIAGIED